MASTTGMTIETQAAGATVVMIVTRPTDDARAVIRWVDRTMAVQAREHGEAIHLAFGDSALHRVADVRRWLDNAARIIELNPQILDEAGGAKAEPEVAPEAPRPASSPEAVQRERRRARIAEAERQLDDVRRFLRHANEYTRSAYEARAAELEGELEALRAEEAADTDATARASVPAPAAPAAPAAPSATAEGYRCPRCGETDPSRFRSGQRPGRAVCDDCAA